MKYYIYIITIIVCFVFCSCIDTGDDVEPRYDISVSNIYPDDADAEPVIGNIVMTESNTGRSFNFTLPIAQSVNIPAGLYDVEASMTVKVAGAKKHMRATASAVTINASVEIPLNWFYYNPESSLIFGEVFFTGSLNAASTGGLRDTYLTIYNNTTDTIWADGLGIAESAFVNSRNNAFEILTESNDRNLNFTASTIWVVPGTGRDYPVAPGESIKIVDQAINWGSLVPGALDHSDATLEWWDDNAQDTDTPLIPNLLKWYCYSNTIWIPSNQCNRSYALVRFPEGMDADEYLAKYRGTYDYISAIGTVMTNSKAYLIPNSWIIDGINLGNDEMWVYGALSPTIDMGYASISTRNSDKERFGKKLSRRVASVCDDGRVILQDTDDSSADFEVYSVK